MTYIIQATNAIDAIDAVPEADYAEQHTLAYPDMDDAPYADEGLTRSELPTGETGWEATDADVVDQSIIVPLPDDGDERDGTMVGYQEFADYS